jgi:cytochrome P450
MSKTPKGEKRHPMSYGPFLGGKRICLGKTFAELFVKVICAIILYKYDIEFVDKECYEKKPAIGVGVKNPSISIRVEKN